MKLYLLLVSLIYITAGFAQHFHRLVNPSIGNHIAVRAADLHPDGGIIASFDYEDGSTPTAGILRTNNTGQLMWCKKLQIPNSMASCSFELLRSATDNYYTYGISFDQTTGDMIVFLSQFNQDGNLLFTKMYPIPNFTSGYSINKLSILNNGDLLMLISVYNQVITVRTDAGGTIIWAKSIACDPLGVGKNPGFDAIELNDGTILSSSKVDDSFSLIKFTAGGDTIYTRDFQIGTYSHIKSLTQNSAGEVFGVGFVQDLADDFTLLLKLDPSNGDIIWAKSLSSTSDVFGSIGLISKAIDEVDGLLITFNYLSGQAPNTPYAQMFAKFDYNGNIITSGTTALNIEMGDYLYTKKTVDNKYLICGFVEFDWGSNYTGLIIKSDSPINFECPIVPAVFDVNPFTNIVENFSYIHTLTPFSADSVAIFTTIDLSSTEASFCSVDAIDEIAKYEIDIYPNPASHSIQINLDPKSIGAIVTITNVDGQVVKTFAMTSTEMNLDISDLPSGVYLVKSGSNGNTQVGRFVKR